MRRNGAAAPELKRLPWRGPGGERPRLALPREGPQAPIGSAMPVRLGGALRKRWRYVGVYAEEMMLCAASVEIGPLAVEFWGIWDREREQMHQATRRLLPGRRRRVALAHGSGDADRAMGAELRIADGDIAVQLTLAPTAPIESVCPNGAGAHVWTRKIAGAPATGTVSVGGRVLEIRGSGSIDDSAGYHARRTSWFWSTGAGISADGSAIAWNLVEGVNDPPRNSERAIWVNGVPSEPDPVSFDGLDGIAFGDGSSLRFNAEGERARRESLGPVVRSSYRAPFGSFSGSLGGIELASGLGVMEEHDALW